MRSRKGSSKAAQLAGFLPARPFGLVGDLLAPQEGVFQQSEQVVGEAQQAGLVGFDQRAAGPEFEVIQRRDGGERIGQGVTHLSFQKPPAFVEQGETPRALETLEKGRDPDRDVVRVGQMLEQVAPALEKKQTTAHPGLQPGGVVERRTVAEVFGGVKRLANGLEKSPQMVDLEWFRMSVKNFGRGMQKQAQMRSEVVDFDRQSAEG